LDLLLGGIGVLWIEIEVTGVPAHAEAADRAQNPVHSIPAILRALASFEDQINMTDGEPAFAAIARPSSPRPRRWPGSWPRSTPAR